MIVGDCSFQKIQRRVPSIVSTDEVGLGGGGV